jgi:hypothetical protein
MSDYQHPNLDKNLMGVQNALKYDADGEPSLRVSIENVEANSGLVNTNYSSAGNLNSSVDAFGRLRISDPVTLFDATNVDYESDKFFNVLSGSAASTHVAATSSTDISVTGAGSVVRQSKRRMSYQPGKSFLFLNTFVFNAGQADLTQRVGLYDDNNGVFFSDTDTTLSFNIRNNGVDNTVTQEDWNVDKLDGTGVSGITLDTTKSQILFTDVEWLGVGSVRIGFVIDGQFVVAHIFHNANINNSVYTRTMNLPVRYEISTGSATASMQTICSSVISEGGYEARAKGKVAGTPTLGGVTVGTDWVNLATIELNDENSIVVPSGIDILNISNTDFEWALLVNAIPTTPFTFVPVSNKVEISTQTFTFTDLGDRIYGGYMGGKTAPASIGNGSLSWDNQLGMEGLATKQTLTLAIRSASSSKSAAGLIKWFEI